MPETQTSNPQTPPSSPPADTLHAVQVGTLKAPATANPILMLALGILLTLNVIGLYDHFFVRPSHPGPTPTPSAPVDTAYTKLGESIEPQLAPAYAAAWLAFAQALDSGEPYSAAVQAFEAKWSSARSTLTASLQSELAKIVPPGTTDDKVTPMQRSSLSAACRGIAQGLTKGKPFLHFLSLPNSPRPAKARSSPEVVDADAFPPRAKLVSHALNTPGPPIDAGREKPTEAPRATLPNPSPAALPEPRWEWRTFVADPRLEVWGYLDESGVFRYAAVRWRTA